MTQFITTSLDEMRRLKLKVTNFCPVVTHIIEIHLDYAASWTQDPRNLASADAG